MKTVQQLTLDDLKRIAQAAEQKAQENQWKVSIAICDAGGHLLWLQRLDGAPVMSATIAPDKARASALSGKPTKALEDMVNGGRVAALAMPIKPLEGAEPIIVDGNVIGAVGVSGVAAADDARIALAGVNAL
ncbi:heme-binding protein [Alcaligenaceae bacterium 429]|jgi:uncharacterized protein GlcG (DUF336 family)|uniref:GlcG/HbpS family heme-binding protein n=1 Tax=Paenalcaligenes TaxID=1100891 RepID=UPI001093227F|nr:heme-binding protein [Paenalcaligenes suwonensis]NHC60798.1 heme-binding protein [Paenalcaligenes suwonensis]TGV07070.1 heme-binding protein [Alcaligenaceae bacterium 429]